MPRYVIARGKISRDGGFLYSGEEVELSKEEAERFPQGMVEEILPLEEEVSPDLLMAEVEEELPPAPEETGSGVYTSPAPARAAKKEKRSKG